VDEGSTQTRQIMFLSLFFSSPGMISSIPFTLSRLSPRFPSCLSLFSSLLFPFLSFPVFLFDPLSVNSSEKKKF